jgi:hypothetical protein
VSPCRLTDEHVMVVAGEPDHLQHPDIVRDALEVRVNRFCVCRDGLLVLTDQHVYVGWHVEEVSVVRRESADHVALRQAALWVR